MATLAAMRSPSVREREDGWRAFHAAHASFIYGAVLRSGVPSEDVDDLFQKVLLVVHRRIQDEDVRRLRPWLRAIVLRVVLEHRRWHRVRRAKAWLTRWMVEEDQRRIPTPEREAEQAEAMRTVWHVLNRMSEKLRQVLILCDLQGCSPSEAAEVLGVPVNTVRSRRRLAKEQFTKRLERLGRTS